MQLYNAADAALVDENHKPGASGGDGHDPHRNIYNQPPSLLPQQHMYYQAQQDHHSAQEAHSVATHSPTDNISPPTLDMSYAQTLRLENAPEPSFLIIDETGQKHSVPLRLGRSWPYMREFIMNKFTMTLDGTSSQQHHSLCNLVDANGILTSEKWEQAIKPGSVVRMIRFGTVDIGTKAQAERGGSEDPGGLKTLWRRTNWSGRRTHSEDSDFNPEDEANFEDTWSSTGRLQRRPRPNPDAASGTHFAREEDNGGPGAAAVTNELAAADDQSGDDPSPRNSRPDMFLNDTDEDSDEEARREFARTQSKFRLPEDENLNEDEAAHREFASKLHELRMRKRRSHTSSIG
ncbi:ankyrin repeat protein [Colletotrichum higginsianum]|nr:ankyrin repeat protein [Colletotrichum higginsianum]